MAEETQTPQATDDWDWDDLLSEFEPEVEAAEKGADDAITKLTKNQRKIAERQAKMEAQAKREKLVSDFYAKASETEREFADVFLAGVTEPDKVSKMLELAPSKARAIAGEPEPAAAAADADDDDDEDVGDALAAPVSGRVEPKDPRRQLAERTKKGDMKAAFIEFMDAPKTAGPVQVKLK